MELRTATPDDADAIGAIFRATIGLGAPLAFEVPRGYQELCLGWYLDRGRSDVALVVDDDRAVGYALVCTDEADHQRWVIGAAARFVVRSMPAAFNPRSPTRAAFVRSRWRDGLRLRQSGAPVAPAHAHVNLLPDHRAGRVGRLLVHHVDAVVARAGLPSWYAEINSRRGR
ncbi:MAG: hypothetical protein AAGF02_16525, partial [Actinomycetota bacterium]